VITVLLANGDSVDVENGNVAHFVFKEEELKVPLKDNALLVVKDSGEYSAKTVATFKAEDVIGFTVAPEDE